MTYIVFEGIPGAGKTHLSNFLATRLTGSYLIPEHVLPENILTVFSADNPGREDVYRLNWTTKDALIQLYNYKKHIIADRYFVTTLAYNYSLSKLQHDDSHYLKTLQWVMDALDKNLLQVPDICIVLSVEASLSNIRKNREENDTVLWSQYNALKHASDFYITELPKLHKFYKKIIIF